MKDVSQQKTLRLKMPQWQGGNNPNSYFGSQLLEWLAPKNGDETVEIDVPEYDGSMAKIENGIAHREALIKQQEQARVLLDERQPDRLVVFGGDCLVDLVPFAYLNEKYGGELGVLWIDAHPDIKTPEDYPNAHTMVLGNLLGEGDKQFRNLVSAPVKPENVMFAGLRTDGLTEQEDEVISRLGLRVAGPYGLLENSAQVINWIEERNIKKLAIHLDLDVLNPTWFGSVFFGEPHPAVDPFEAFPEGKMSLSSLTRLMQDVSENAEIVGLGITEFLPWDAINLRKLLSGFPILN